MSTSTRSTTPPIGRVERVVEVEDDVRRATGPANVSQLSTLPLSKPRRNHCTRCSDEPCVNDSGCTPPPMRCWMRSSPIADGGVERVLDVAGLEDVALLRRVPPDAGEAVGLELHADGERVLEVGALLLRLAHLLVDAEDVLHVVADLVREHVGLREVAALGAEARAQVLVEAEVDVRLLVERAVERPHRRLRHAAARLHGLAEEDELRRPVASRQQLRPRRLRVVEDEGDELHPLRLLGRRLDRAPPAWSSATSSRRAARGARGSSAP